MTPSVIPARILRDDVGVLVALSRRASSATGHAVVGVSGSGGSGESTLADALAQALAVEGLEVHQVHVDDHLRTRPLSTRGDDWPNVKREWSTTSGAAARGP